MIDRAKLPTKGPRRAKRAKKGGSALNGQFDKLLEQLQAPKPALQRAPRVIFFLVVDRNNTVYLRVKAGQETRDLSLRFKCRPESLDKENWVVRDDPEATEKLQVYKASILEAEARLFRLGETATPKRVIEFVMAERGQVLTPSVKTALGTILRVYEGRYKVGQISHYTINQAAQYTARACEWIDAKHPNLRFGELKGSHADSFHHYFTVERKFSLAYVRKMFSFFRQAVNYGIREEWVNRDPFAGWKSPRETIRRIEYLTEDELTAIEKHHFVNPTLEAVRDCFLAQCYSGLAYVDLRAFSEHHLVSYDGIPSVRVSRSKSGVDAVIPVLPPLQALIDKYADTPHRQRTKRLFPVLSNQKMNFWLKSVGEIVGITKRLTTHIGRKTWGTLVANLNVSEGSLAKSMGHTTTAMTRKHYAEQHEASTVREIFGRWNERNSHPKAANE